MPKPKHPSRGDRPAAERPFVDREELIAAFRTALHETVRSEPKVLVYHGGAGIGKSRLRRELVRQLADDSSVVTAELDFAIPSYRQTESALLFLRNTIRETYKVSFPSFDLAYAVMWQKGHPEVPLGDDVKPLLEPGSLLPQLLDASGKLPLLGLIPKISKLLAASLDPSTTRPVDHFLSDWWAQRGERELEDLPQMEPAAIVECLPKLWAEDIKDYLSEDTTRRENRGQSLGAAASNVPRAPQERALRDSPHFRGHVPARRAVLFIDSYEQLWGTGDGGQETVDSRQGTDAWVRGLVKQLPEVLWVISGRQRLRWEEAEKEWGDVLSQHELGPLSEHSVRQFLASCGIPNEPIQDAIVKGSQGVPHYLDLAVDTFLEIEQSGQRAGSVQSLFSGAESSDSPEQLFAQFIRHLNQPQIKTLQILSASRFWYYGLFEHLVTEYQTGYPLSAYDDLSRFSFIRQSDSGGTQMMHELMREALQEHQAPELRKRVHLFLFEYYAKQLEGLDVKGITEQHKAALNEAFYHGRQAKSAAELWAWFEPAAKVLSEAAQSRLLAPLCREMAQVLEADLGPDHVAVAAALSKLATELMYLGLCEEAEPLLRRSLVIREKALGPEHPVTGDSLDDLAQLLQSQAKYAEAEPLLRRGVAIGAQAHGPEQQAVSLRLHHLAGCLSSQGKYAEAEPLYRRALAIAEKTAGPAHQSVARSLSGLALLLLTTKGKCAEAESLYRRVLAIYEDALGPDHPNVARTLDYLATLLQVEAKYAEAEPLFRRALAIYEKVLGPEHPETARILGNLAILLHSRGKSAEAQELARRALATKEKTLGPEHVNVAYDLNTLSMLLCEQRRYAEAEELARRALRIWENGLGSDHPDVRIGLFTLGGVFWEQRRYAEAEALMWRVLTICEKGYGPEHIDVANSLHNLSDLLREQRRYAEAEPLARRALTITEKVFGPDHPEVAGNLCALVEHLVPQSKYAEAEPLVRRALAIRDAKLGPNHPLVAQTLEVLVKVCEQTGRTAEAQEFSARAKSIRDKNAQPQTQP